MLCVNPNSVLIRRVHVLKNKNTGFVYIMYLFIAGRSLNSDFLKFQSVLIPGRKDATIGPLTHGTCPAGSRCLGGGHPSQFWP